MLTLPLGCILDILPHDTRWNTRLELGDVCPCNREHACSALPPSFTFRGDPMDAYAIANSVYRGNLKKDFFGGGISWPWEMAAVPSRTQAVLAPGQVRCLHCASMLAQG